MFYIKLESDMSLIITVREPIYRGDNLNQKIRYLLPLTIGEIDTQAAFVYLNYIRADGTPDVVRLDRLDEKYNESYYQYVFPVTCRLTRCPGQVCTWMQIYMGSPSNPMISKSGECILQIEDSKNMDDYFCDHQLTALYQLEKNIASDMDEVNGAVAAKADGLSYNKDTRELQLKSGEETVGEAVIVPSDEFIEDATKDADDTWSDMDDPDDGSGNDDWESM